MSLFNSEKISDFIVHQAHIVMQPSCPLLKCNYCSRVSLKLQSNCDGCGAALEIPDGLIRQLAEPPMLYHPSVIDEKDLVMLGRPGRNIPINLFDGKGTGALG